MIETEKRVHEAVRYLGFGRNEADERTLELIQQSFKDLEQEASYRRRKTGYWTDGDSK